MFKIKTKKGAGLKKHRVKRIGGSIYLGFPDRVRLEAGQIRKSASAAFGAAVITTALGAAPGILSPSSAWALPTGGQVAAGSAAIAQIGATAMQITQSSNSAIINWNGYNINVNELVKYIQPGASSVILNRVTGADPSSILGQLVANGRVFIVNPNGVLFGAASKVDVAGLLATTFSIKDSDFMQGNFTFNQDPLKKSSYVINQGTIKVADNGFVFLVAPAVSNQGLIVANLGKVALASGNSFTVDFFGDGLIKYQVSGSTADEVTGPDGKPITSAVSNSGTIQANGGTVLLSADATNELLSSVVNNSGVIEATSLGMQNGQIVLQGGSQGVVSDSGMLDASGKGAGPMGSTIKQTGGTIELTGDEVGLFGDAHLDVSGDAGGGSIFAGGGEHGASLGVPDATALYGGKGVSINASALNTGDGGKVVLWSNGSTRFHGAIEATGGAISGDGGFVETSGHDLNVQGATVNVAAPSGKAGLWLLDPNDVNIGASSASASTSGGIWKSTGTVTISASQISSTLSGGTNVDIQTSGNGSQNGDITLESGYNITDSGNTPVTLTLNADRNISLNGNISATGTATGTLGVTLSAGQNAGDTSGSVSLVGSAIRTNSGAVGITANTGINIDSNSLIWTQSRASTGLNGGNITIKTTSTSGTSGFPSGGITIAGALDAYGAPNYANSNGGGTGGTITVSTAGPYASISLSNVSVAIDDHGGQGGSSMRSIFGNGGKGGAVNISTSGSNASIDISGIVSVDGGLGSNAGGGGGTASIKTTGANGSTITIAGPLEAAAGSGWTNTGVTGGTVTISTSGSSSGINIENSIEGSGPFLKEAGGTVDISASGTGSAITTTASGQINVEGNGATNGNIIVAGAGIGLGGSVTGGSVTLAAGNSATNMDIGTSCGAGNLCISNADLGYVTATGGLTLGSASTGTVTLTSAEDFPASYTHVSGPLELEGANIAVNSALTAPAGAVLELDTTGSATQTGAITASSLDLEGAGGSYTLTNAGNPVGTLAANTGSVDFTDGSALAVGSVGSTNGITATGDVTLTADSLTLSQPVSGTGSLILEPLTATTTIGLEGGAGAFNLTGAELNEIQSGFTGITIGNAGGTGTITFGSGSGPGYTFNAGLTLRNTGTSSGGIAIDDPLSAGAGTLALNTNGAATQSATNGAITAGTLDLEGAGGTFTLGNTGNSVGTLITNTYDATLDDSSAIVLGTSSLTGTLDVIAAGSITQSGAVTGSSLVAKTLLDAGAPIDLGNSGNHFGNIDLRSLNSADTAYASGDITYTDSGTVNVGYVSTLGTITITASGNITVSHVDPANVIMTSTGGSINSDGSGGTINGGSVTLNAASGIGNTNTILTNTGSLSATAASGSANISNTGSLEADITSGGSVNLSSGGDITVNTIDAQGGSASLSASGSILGAAGNQLTASDGATLSAASGTIGSAYQSLNLDVPVGTVDAASTGQNFLTGNFSMLGALPDYVSINFNTQYINEFRDENGWLTGPVPPGKKEKRLVNYNNGGKNGSGKAQEE